MKRIFFFICSFLVLKSMGQTSFIVSLLNSTVAINSASIIYTTTTAENTTDITFDIKNTSNSSKSYRVKRYDLILNTASSSTAVARFCFAGNCYLSSTIISPTVLTLMAGQSATSLQGANQVLDCNLDEASLKGYSLVKYTIVNSVLASDSMQFSLRYNDPNAPVLIKETFKNSTVFDVYPNPAVDNVVLKINSQKTVFSKLSIFNALGALVLEKEIFVSEGKNNFELDLTNLSSGIYVVSIKTGAITSTKKLIIQ